MTTVTLHLPGGARRALEGQCLASPHTLVTILNLISILILKPHLNHPGQCWVTQASLYYWWGKSDLKIVRMLSIFWGNNYLHWAATNCSLKLSFKIKFLLVSLSLALIPVGLAAKYWIFF